MNVMFEGPAGPLEGSLWAPANGVAKAAVVVCHPHPAHGGSMQNSVVFRAARGLQEAGLTVLRFNFRGVGRSAGTHDGRGAEDGDLSSALDFMAARFDDLPLWGAGFSFGARTLARVAGKDPRIERVILLGLPVLAYSLEFLADVRQPGLVVMAERDEFGTLSALRERFPDFVARMDVLEVTDVGHFFTGKLRQVQAHVRSWSRSALGDDAGGATGSEAATEDEAFASPEDVYPEGDSPAIRVVMMPRDTNAVGTIFGGVILSEIDLAAAIEAHKHHPGRIVTVSMDKIDFKAPVRVGDLVSLFTRTMSIGRSSIRIHVSVWAQRRFGGGAHEYVTEAQVTMVAVDEDMRPVPVGEV